MHASLALFTFIFFCSLFAHAEGAAIDSTADSVKSLIEKIPNGHLKSGLRDYANILTHSPYQSDGAVKDSNAGLVSYFVASFEHPKNSCVRDAALPFYTEVAEVLRNKTYQNPDCNSGEFIPDYGCSVRPGIHSQVGKDEFKDLETGWLWKLAMKHAKGDPNSAMFLVGICGHDDANRSYMSFEDSSESALQELQEEIKYLQDEKKNLQTEIAQKMKNVDKNEKAILRLSNQLSNLNTQIAELKSKNSLDRNMSCPEKDTGFYAPGSLGEKADIPDSLKKDISTIQGQDGGANIPAKHYHVYGAAFMACQLIQNGWSKTEATVLQKQAARAYRGVRMCEVVSDRLNTAQELENLFSQFSKQVKKANPEQIAVYAANRVRKNQVTCKFSSTVGEHLPPECQLLDLYDIPPSNLLSGELELTDEQIKDKARAFSKSIDAATLYRDWYMGGEKVLGTQMPCSDIRVWGPSDLMNPNKGFFNRLSRPSGWSDIRYSEASRKLATWDVDFKWTIAQHEVGAQFAGENCKKRGPNEKPLKGICPQGPPGDESPAVSSPKKSEQTKQSGTR